MSPMLDLLHTQTLKPHDDESNNGGKFGTFAEELDSN